MWDRVIAVNLSSVFHCMRSGIAVMHAAGRGSIVNMASMLGQVAFPSVSAYVAAKHGVVGLTKAAALDHAADGIRINAVGPTFITTELVTSTIDQEGLDAFAAGHPGGRLGAPRRSPSSSRGWRRMRRRSPREALPNRRRVVAR